MQLTDLTEHAPSSLKISWSRGLQMRLMMWGCDVTTSTLWSTLHFQFNLPGKVQLHVCNVRDQQCFDVSITLTCSWFFISCLSAEILVFLRQDQALLSMFALAMNTWTEFSGKHARTETWTCPMWRIKLLCRLLPLCHLTRCTETVRSHLHSVTPQSWFLWIVRTRVLLPGVCLSMPAAGV